MIKTLKYILLGFYFGFVLIKSEAVSWYRIVEMFHFQSFHLFGVIGSAVVTGIVSIFLIKRLYLTTLDDEVVDLTPKPIRFKANFFGGILFGLGWSLVGACTAPLFIHFGAGSYIIIVALAAAILGTFIYGTIKHKLPH